MNLFFKVMLISFCILIFVLPTRHSRYKSDKIDVYLKGDLIEQVDKSEYAERIDALNHVRLMWAAELGISGKVSIFFNKTDSEMKIVWYDSEGYEIKTLAFNMSPSAVIQFKGKTFNINYVSPEKI